MEKREYTQPKSRACKECKKSEAKRAPMPHTETGSPAWTAASHGRGREAEREHREYDESPEEYRDRLVQAIGTDPDRYLVHAEIVRTEQERRVSPVGALAHRPTDHGDAQGRSEGG
jgi:hypothetical protein